VPEPPRGKAHWDYVLEEMAWMAHDFAEERRFKMALARRVSKEVLRYHQARRTREEREARKEEQRLRRHASMIAREVTAFWHSVEKLVRHKHQTRLDQRKREALDKHLDFLVGQTERYSTMLAEELAAPASSRADATTLGAAPVNFPLLLVVSLLLVRWPFFFFFFFLENSPGRGWWWWRRGRHRPYRSFFQRAKAHPARECSSSSSSSSCGERYQYGRGRRVPPRT
jgi:hypothetical protein